MRIPFSTLATFGFTLAILCTGCKTTPETPAPPTPSSAAILLRPVLGAVLPETAPLASVKYAVAGIIPLSGSKVTGQVTFAETSKGVEVVADISGLTPGKHAFHIHEFGDLTTPKGMSAGGHYNPNHEKHGLPGAAHHHPGDMGNLVADASGKAHLEISLAGVTIAGENFPILGRSVIIHEKEDDGSQPTGNAGGRVGGGVIGVAKPPK